MPGLGRKTWSPGDTLNAADVNGYLMDQSVMVFAGTAARSSAIPSPSAGMVAYSTATSLQVYNGSAWVSVSTGYGAASGGSAITVGGTAYQYVAITSTGSFTPTTAGLFDVMVIGGGGAGGGSGNLAAYQVGAGGGSGQAVQATMYLSASAQTIVVGAGGTGTSYREGSKGGYSQAAFSLMAIGGGGGMGGIANLSSASVGAGGGGGAEGNNSHVGAYFGNGAYGYNGGNSTGQNAGGGGGQGSVGSPGSGTNGAVGGNGGTGYDVSAFIGGSTLYKQCGGGGASNGGTNGTGGNGVGGNGGGAPGGSAAANTASGGGGASYSGTASVGGAGGSGIVYIRWKV